MSVSHAIITSIPSLYQWPQNTHTPHYNHTLFIPIPIPSLHPYPYPHYTHAFTLPLPLTSSAPPLYLILTIHPLKMSLIILLILYVEIINTCDTYGHADGQRKLMKQLNSLKIPALLIVNMKCPGENRQVPLFPPKSLFYKVSPRELTHTRPPL